MNRIIARILENKEEINNDYYIGLNANNCVFADDINDINSYEFKLTKNNNILSVDGDVNTILEYLNNNKAFIVKMIGYPNIDLKVNGEILDFGLMTILQNYNSAVTSLNQVSRVHTSIDWQPDTVVLDYGGGKFDKATEYMKDKGVLNLVYDPFNRKASHNNEVLSYLAEYGGADSVICANVLNVIQEDDVVKKVLKDLDKYCKSGGKIYICVYEGNKSGDGKNDDKRKSYQRNMKTKGYLPIIEEMYPNYNISIRNNIVEVQK